MSNPGGWPDEKTRAIWKHEEILKELGREERLVTASPKSEKLNISKRETATTTN